MSRAVIQYAEMSDSRLGHKYEHTKNVLLLPPLVYSIIVDGFHFLFSKFSSVIYTIPSPKMTIEEPIPIDGFCCKKQIGRDR